MIGQITRPQSDAIIFGFDSAWTDDPKSPGAICAIAFDREGKATVALPELVSFSNAISTIDERKQAFSLCLVAIDQPTIVPNDKGCRPVDRVAASVVSFAGGGVQPANTNKRGMFDESAPIWRFKKALKASDSFDDARRSRSGTFLIEVFPALALAGLNDQFSRRLGAPKYNPKNRRIFRISHWQAVAQTVCVAADNFHLTDLADWASEQNRIQSPVKGNQDCLDAAICALVGLIWRGCDPAEAVVIGDTKSGFIITPVSIETHTRLKSAAQSCAVPIA